MSSSCRSLPLASYSVSSWPTYHHVLPKRNRSATLTTPVPSRLSCPLCCCWLASMPVVIRWLEATYLSGRVQSSPPFYLLFSCISNFAMPRSQLFPSVCFYIVLFGRVALLTSSPTWLPSPLYTTSPSTFKSRAATRLIQVSASFPRALAPRLAPTVPAY